MATFWPEHRVLARSVAAKLRAGGEARLAARLERCGEEVGSVRCQNCGRSHPARYTCNLRWCPVCAWRISARRAALVSAWAETCAQPKHVVLTGRNTESPEPRRYGDAFARLRRQKPFRDWTRGCRTIETTNEGRGWHVHLHALVDVRWIDPGELARRWGRLLGQEFAIVKVKDARLIEYLAELAKYACKPAQMAAWPEAEATQFVRACRGVRLFSTWGDLRGFKPPPKPQRECEHCGAQAWDFEPLPLAARLDAVLEHAKTWD